MKETPILMTPENAQKCHDGRKTQTRRLNKLEEINKSPDEWELRAYFDSLAHFFPKDGFAGASIKCPYGVVGDRLWIRETTALWREGWDRTGHVIYKGGMVDKYGEYFSRPDLMGLSKWTPSIHMPRIRCRTVLEITDIRVQRVQEISEEDAKAEGVTIRPDAEIAARVAGDTPARMEFWALWKSINGAGSWQKNPWVWALTFKKVQP